MPPCFSWLGEFFFLKNFQAIVIYIQYNLLLCALLTVLGVIVLRWTHPDLPRPYRVWAYPLPPLIFAGITIWMMIYLLQSNPIESLSGHRHDGRGVATLLFCRDAASKKGSMKTFLCLLICGSPCRSWPARPSPQHQ